MNTIVGSLCLFVLSLGVMPEAVEIIAGGHEFTDWIGITMSNKTWMFYGCMVVIGGSAGYLCWWVTLGKRRKQNWLRKIFEERS